MKLQINGEIKFLDLPNEPSSLITLINRLGLEPQTIVIELNGAIVRSDKWEGQKIKDGDIVEIVTIVGGGS